MKIKKLVALLIAVLMITTMAIPANAAQIVSEATGATVDEATVGAQTNEAQVSADTPTEPLIISSGSCGNNMTYELTRTGKLTITGSGEMTGCGWNSYAERIVSVSISSGVTSICGNAFSGCSKLGSLTIPSAVTAIGSSAFKNCVKLTSLTIPSGVTVINTSVFEGCAGLTSVTLSSNITSIATNAFKGCIKLKSIEIPDSVTGISKGAFEGCEQLERINIPANVKTIGSRSGSTRLPDKVFVGCTSLKEINVDENNEVYASVDGVLFNKDLSMLYYFPNANCSSYEISDSVTTIGVGAFSGSTSLKTVKVPINVTDIKNRAFESCASLESVQIYNFEAKIATGSFADSNNFTICGYNDSSAQEYAATNNYNFESLGDYIITGECGESANYTLNVSTGELTISGTGAMDDYDFFSKNDRPWEHWKSRIKSVIVENDITTVGEESFYGYTALESVTLPTSIRKIENKAFCGCTSLAGIQIPQNVIGPDGPSCKITIGESAFAGCTSLASVNLPEGVSVIDGSAFNGCTALTSIEIPASVTSLGANAFSGCTALNAAYLFNKNISIYGGTFGNTADDFTIYGYSDSTAQTYAGNNNHTFKLLDDYYVKGKCGENAEFSLNVNTGELKITGAGNMYNYEPEKTPWYNYMDKVKSAIVGSGITNVGDYAFANHHVLTSVTVQPGVTTIGKNAFENSENLASVTLSSSVLTIGDYAFNYCKNLTEVDLSYGITTIGNYAFSSCVKLPSITMPSSVTKVCEGAFSGCTKLEAVHLSPNVTEIGTHAFDLCESMESIWIPDGITKINDYVFFHCYKLEGIEGAEKLKSIGEHAFEGTAIGDKLELMSSITEISSSAFSNCSVLQNVFITNSNANMGTDVFSGTNITIHGYTNSTAHTYAKANNHRFVSLGDCITGECGENGDNVKYSLNLDTGVLLLTGKGAVYPYEQGKAPWNDYMDKITSVSVADGITGADNVAVAGSNVPRVPAAGFASNTPASDIISGKCGDNAYYYINIATGEVSITGSGNMYDYSTDVSPFYNYTSIITSVTFEDEITKVGNCAFRGCSKLTTVKLPSKLVSIGESAFESCSALTNIDIPSGVTEIGGGAFNSCSQLKSIKIPSGVTRIENYTFNYCRKLESVELPERITFIGASAFATCSELVNITIPSGVTEIGRSAFESCTKINITIPSKVEKIWPNAFYKCTSLTNVTLPSSVTFAGKEAFAGCTALENVQIESGLKSITDYMFSGCTNLTSINLPESIETIARCAFSECGKLTDIEIPSGVTSIGKAAFLNCTSLTDIKLPSNIAYISESTFSGCIGLTNVEIPSKVVEIYGSAFSGCTGLKEIKIPISVKIVGNSAFFGCSSLESAYIYRVNATLYNDIFKDTAEEFTIYGYNNSTAQTYANANSHRFVSLGDYCISGKCGENAEFVLNTGTGVIEITGTGDMYDFSGYDNTPWHDYMDTIKTANFADEITSVGAYSFDCAFITSKFESVKLPANLKKIGPSAFYNCSKLTDVELPPKVESIGYGAFSGCSGLTSIKIPSNVESIEDSVFSGCSGLTSVEIPSGVKTIGQYAFSNTGLTTVNLPSSVAEIKYRAFYGCSKLESAYIYNRNVDISSYVFANAAEGFTIHGYSNSTAQTYADSNNHNFVPFDEPATEAPTQAPTTAPTEAPTQAPTTAPTEQIITGQCGENAYYSLNLTTGEMKITGSGDMYDYNHNTMPWYEYRRSIKSLSFEEGITGIGVYSFYNCQRLNSVSLPESLVKIGDQAFQYTALKNITIPENVSLIGSRVFLKSFLSNVTVNENNENYCSVNGVLLNKEKTTLIYYPTYKTGEFLDIPESVKVFEEYAVAGNYYLTTAEIPQNVTTVKGYAFWDDDKLVSISIPKSVTSVNGDFVLACDYLTSISVDDNNNNYCSVDGVLYNKGKTKLVAYPYNKAGDAYTLPDTVVLFDSYSFGYNKNLKRIDFPVSVSKLTDRTLYDAKSLTDVYLYNRNITLYGANIFPAGITLHGYAGSTVQTYAENNNFKFEAIDEEPIEPATEPATEAPTQASTTAPTEAPTQAPTEAPTEQIITGQCGENAYYSLNLTTGEMKITGSGDMYDYNNYGNNKTPWYDYTSKITNVSFENGITSVGDFALQYCYNLVSVTLPESIKKIGYTGFSYCSKLESVNIPSNVTTIGDWAFANCSSLLNVNIPASVTSLTTTSFVSCDKLQSIDVNENNANYCSVDGVLFNKDKTTLLTYPTAKQGSTYTVPDTVTQIGFRSFNYNANLATVNIPTSVTFIENCAFEGAKSLTDIYVYNYLVNFGSETSFSDTVNELTFHGYNNSTAQTYAADNNHKFESLGDFILSGQCGENAYYTLNVSTGEMKITGSGDMYDYTWENLPPWNDYKTQITSLTFEDAITNVGQLTFSYCYSLTSVTLPESLSEIDSQAFVGCSMLTSIEIPENVTTINAYAFAYTGLTSVTIPASVTSVQGTSFGSCSSLTAINVDENNSNYSSVDGVLFTKNRTMLMTYPGGKAGDTYTIPGTVATIGQAAFNSVSNLARVDIPLNVNTIGWSAFGYSTSIKDVYVYNPSAEFDGAYVFAGDSDLTLHGYDNSTAQTYATENNIKFESLGEAPYTTIKLHVKHGVGADNYSFGWQPHIWAWYTKDGAAKNVFTEWPGEAAMSGDDGWYDISFSVLKGSEWNFIVSNNGNPQTADYTGFSDSQNELWVVIDDKNVKQQGEWLRIYDNKDDAESFISSYKLYCLVSDIGSWTPSENIMTDNGDGTYSISYENVKQGNYYLYVLENGMWDTYYDGYAYVKADARVTVTFNPNAEYAWQRITTKITYYECTIHAKVAPSWNSNPYIHYWKTTEAVSTDWPGVEMTTKEDGGWFTYKLTDAQEYFIINNGGNGHQTYDIPIEAPEYWIICREDGNGYSLYESNPGDDETVTVNFNTNGGTEVESITGDVFSGVTIPETVPAKRSAAFHGWYVNNGSYVYWMNAGDLYCDPGVLQLNAAWEIDGTYRVHVKTGSHTPYIYYSGKNYDPDNYVDWPGVEMISNGDGSYYYDVPGKCPIVSIICNDETNGQRQTVEIPINLPAEVEITVDDTITEEWSYLNYDIKYLVTKNTIDFVTGDGETIPPMDFDEGKSVTVNDLPMAKREGYIFTGWFADEECTKPLAANTVIDSSITLYAGWQEIGEVTIGSDDKTSSATSGSAFELFGAQIRLQPSMGLRFCTRVSTKMLDSLKETTGYDAQYGYVLGFKDSIVEGSDFVVGAKTVSGKTVKERMSEYDYYISDDYVVYTACVLNIPLASYDKDIAARPFIKYTDANGVLRYHYFTEKGSKSIGGAYYTSLYDFAEYVYDNGLESEDYRNTLNNEIITAYDIYYDNLNKGENEHDKEEI